MTVARPTRRNVIVITNDEAAFGMRFAVFLRKQGSAFEVGGALEHARDLGFHAL